MNLTMISLCRIEWLLYSQLIDIDYLPNQMNVFHNNRSPSRSPRSPTILRYRHSARRSSFNSSVWEIHRSSKGEIYYYNTVTDRSQWEKPPNEQLISKRLAIFHCWKKSISAKRHRYSLNRPSNKIKRKKTNRHYFDRRKPLNDSPLSPPANEQIPLNLVDPLPTPILFLPETQDEQSNKKQLCLHPSESTINAILQLEHSSSSTLVESPTISVSQLVSLRTDLICLRLRFATNRFYLLKYHHFFVNQEDLLHKLR